MTYNLYADVFFVINLAMDFMLLTVLKKVFKYKSCLRRRLLASTAGALWASLVTVWPILPRSVELIFTYAGVSSLMVWIAYGLKNWKEIGKAVIGLYLTAIFFGGAIYGLYQHTKAGYYIELLLRGKFSQSLPFFILLLMAAGSCFLISWGWQAGEIIRKRRENLYQVTLHYQGKTNTMTGLMDTGNHLFEPVTHKPVHVATYEAIHPLCGTVANVVFIPYQSVGKEKGMMPAVFLDEMELTQGERVNRISRPLVAICKQPLSPSGEYQILLHEE